jgi:hypothetical protein
MISLNGILLFLKYVVAAIIFVGILLTPAYLAAVNDRSKYDSMRARMGSWMFGWSFFGWLFALFVAAKK